ncbi:MAG: hypothetical protein KAH98_04550, partial [Dehalococcoidia bacterium]|nr:hypothetical protein [Dehalococcoidia bacterium]
MDLATLRKILELERKKGYGDGAVFGGLDRYLERWTNELPQRLLPASYASLDIRRRGEWVESMLRWLDGREDKGRRAPALGAKKAKKEKIDQNLDAPITTVTGLSAKLAPKFRRLGVETVR